MSKAFSSMQLSYCSLKPYFSILSKIISLFNNSSADGLFFGFLASINVIILNKSSEYLKGNGSNSPFITFEYNACIEVPLKGNFKADIS